MNDVSFYDIHEDGSDIYDSDFEVPNLAEADSSKHIIEIIKIDCSKVSSIKEETFMEAVCVFKMY